MLLRKGVINEVLTVYGSVVPAPGALKTLSVPYESQVKRILVSKGQQVSEGEPLVEVEPSPDTYLQLRQARDNAQVARQSLDYMQRRFDLKLATNDQLLQAKQAFSQAQLTLQSMVDRGVDGRKELKSDIAGLVAQIFVQEGAIVPAGQRMMETVAQGRLEIRLGVEPEDISHVKVGGPVSLSDVNVPVAKATAGRIRTISQAVNPATRLVDVFVEFSSAGSFLMEEYILGRITIASGSGLIAPRSAVLPEDNHYTLFTVNQQRAVKHEVKVGLENDKEVQVLGPNLKEGQDVVILGNYVLTDGMAVEIQPGS